MVSGDVGHVGLRFLDRALGNWDRSDGCGGLGPLAPGSWVLVPTMDL